MIHVKLQRDDDSAFHIAHTHVGVDNGAVYRNWSVSVGGAVSRHNLVTRQREEGGYIEIKGLALGQIKELWTPIRVSSIQSRMVSLTRFIRQ